jgi:hypothetical protein
MPAMPLVDNAAEFVGHHHQRDERDLIEQIEERQSIFLNHVIAGQDEVGDSVQSHLVNE